MARLTRSALIIVAVLALLVTSPRPAAAYSVLAHEANIDALWDTGIKPLLQRRFPQTTAAGLKEARAYAYGGSVIQDLGYYPFGAHFFSNLLHYVRTGDFVEILIRDARDVNEYAFALGALGHYASDNTGHPVAVNRAVPMMFPDLRRKFGDTVTYVESPARHIIVEFSFDVVQVAGGAYAPEAYHSFIGFKVAKPLLERAFCDVYGLEMKDLFFDEDLALSTYRHAISNTIPEITKVAWRDKHDEIAKLTPGIQREKFVFNYSRQDYDREYGANYRHPTLFSRFLAFVYRLLPKIGPLRPLSFKAPTPKAEQLFLDSFKETRERYRDALSSLRGGRLDLANTNFDIGKATRRGDYELADKTYAELLGRYADRGFANVPPAMRRNLNAFYATTPESLSKKERKRDKKIRRQLAQLNAS